MNLATHPIKIVICLLVLVAIVSCQSPLSSDVCLRLSQSTSCQPICPLLTFQYNRICYRYLSGCLQHLNATFCLICRRGYDRTFGTSAGITIGGGAINTGESTCIRSPRIKKYSVSSIATIPNALSAEQLLLSLSTNVNQLPAIQDFLETNHQQLNLNTYCITQADSLPLPNEKTLIGVVYQSSIKGRSIYIDAVVLVTNSTPIMIEQFRWNVQSTPVFPTRFNYLLQSSLLVSKQWNQAITIPSSLTDTTRLNLNAIIIEVKKPVPNPVDLQFDITFQSSPLVFWSITMRRDPLATVQSAVINLLSDIGIKPRFVINVQIRGQASTVYRVNNLMALTTNGLPVQSDEAIRLFDRSLRDNQSDIKQALLVTGFIYTNYLDQLSSNSLWARMDQQTSTTINSILSRSSTMFVMTYSNLNTYQLEYRSTRRLTIRAKDTPITGINNDQSFRSLPIVIDAVDSFKKIYPTLSGLVITNAYIDNRLTQTGYFIFDLSGLIRVEVISVPARGIFSIISVSRLASSTPSPLVSPIALASSLGQTRTQIRSPPNYRAFVQDQDFYAYIRRLLNLFQPRIFFYSDTLLFTKSQLNRVEYYFTTTCSINRQIQPLPIALITQVPDPVDICEFYLTSSTGVFRIFINRASFTVGTNNAIWNGNVVPRNIIASNLASRNVGNVFLIVSRTQDPLGSQVVQVLTTSGTITLTYPARAVNAPPDSPTTTTIASNICTFTDSAIEGAALAWSAQSYFRRIQTAYKSWTILNSMISVKTIGSTRVNTDSLTQFSVWFVLREPITFRMVVLEVVTSPPSLYSTNSIRRIGQILPNDCDLCRVALSQFRQDATINTQTKQYGQIIDAFQSSSTSIALIVASPTQTYEVTYNIQSRTSTNNLLENKFALPNFLLGVRPLTDSNRQSLVFLSFMSLIRARGLLLVPRNILYLKQTVTRSTNSVLTFYESLTFDGVQFSGISFSVTTSTIAPVPPPTIVVTLTSYDSSGSQSRYCRQYNGRGQCIDCILATQVFKNGVCVTKIPGCLTQESRMCLECENRVQRKTSVCKSDCNQLLSSNIVVLPNL